MFSGQRFAVPVPTDTWPRDTRGTLQLEIMVLQFGQPSHFYTGTQFANKRINSNYRRQFVHMFTVIRYA